jgi:thiosulfate/3-mercaptopyruvate sulfurtransferase
MLRHADLLLSPDELAKGLQSGRCIAVDCRFDLSDPERGRMSYLSGHITGAHYAHLDRDLSSPITALSGRHPLPDRIAFEAFLRRIGWNRGKLLVAYDERNSAMAVRLWWLMRYFGQAAAILNGGIEAWLRSGFLLQAGDVPAEVTEFSVLTEQPGLTASAPEILDQIERPVLTIIDARAPERFSGEIEPIDSKAGHIPGALNRPLGKNLDSSGQFKQPDQLRAEFEALLQERPSSTVVHSCGSGVTACHNHFAMELAGLTNSRIYPGSWSEWVRDENRPVATGLQN